MKRSIQALLSTLCLASLLSLAVIASENPASSSGAKKGRRRTRRLVEFDTEDVVDEPSQHLMSGPNSDFFDRPSSVHQRQHTGLFLDIIPNIYDYFLENGVFPPSVPEVPGYETSYDDRLFQENTRGKQTYYIYEYNFAMDVSQSRMVEEAWQRLLAARNPKALELRERYRESALAPLRYIRAQKRAQDAGLIEGQESDGNEEYRYAARVFEKYHYMNISENVYQELLAQSNPIAREARAMYYHVYQEEV